MTRPICNFLAALNQTIKKNGNKFKVAYFRQSYELLRALIDAGFIQYYTRSGDTLTVYVRVSPNGPILSSVSQFSKPSRKRYIRWKQLKDKTGLQLILSGGFILPYPLAKKRKVGGIALAEFF